MEKFKKIDEDLYCEIAEKDLDIQDFLCDNVKVHRLGTLADYEISIDQSLMDCESPIEQILAMELERVGITNMLLFNPYIDVVSVEKQAVIEIDNKNYRVDMLLPVIYLNRGHEKKYKLFVIECDGHEFHQKTKEQVERDNTRTRALQKAGYEIIRFSGREINKSPYRCVKEIINIILSKYEV